MSRIKIYTGNNLTDVKDLAKPLINSVLWERDMVMLLGTEKAGKSILAQQIAFSLTSGKPFLDKYEVPKPVSVLYLQTEGKDAEMARRIECMEEALPNNRQLFHRAYKKFLPLDVADFKNELINQIRTLRPAPRVLIIDSLYTSMVGDLTHNRDVRYLLAELSHIGDLFEMTVLIIHHEVKEGFEMGEDKKYHKVHQGDKRSYGSVFLRAFVEHILYLSNIGKPRELRRRLTCDTTRTGQVFEAEDLVLVQPKPLYFEAVEETNKEQGLVETLLDRDKFVTAEVVANEFKIDQVRVDKAIRFMSLTGTIVKEDGRWRRK